MERFSKGAARRWASCKARSVCRDGSGKSALDRAGKWIRSRYSKQAAGLEAFKMFNVLPFFYGPVPILSLLKEGFLNRFSLAFEPSSQLPAGGSNIVSAFGTHAVADPMFVEDVAERANGFAGRWPVIG